MSKKTLNLFVVLSLLVILSVNAMAKDNISFWHIYNVEADGKPNLDQAMEETKKIYPDVTFEESPMEDAAYKTKMVVSLNAGDIPDIYLTWGGGWLKRFVDSGYTKDLTPWLEENPEIKDAFVDSVWGPATFDDKIYGLPCGTMSPSLVYFNKKIFAQYDLEYPETFEELKEVVKVLRENDIIPFALANQEKWPASMFY